MNLRMMFRDLSRSLKCLLKGHRVIQYDTTLYCIRCYRWSFDQGETWI